jgi:P27 family predicted phage terminase small subunit
MLSDTATDRPMEQGHAPPDWLDHDARRLWRQLEPLVRDDEGARRRLAALCVAHSWWDRAAALIAGLDPADLAWQDTDGGLHRHPAVTIEDTLAADLDELSRSLGLEAMGRPRPRRTAIVFLDEGE